MQSNANPTTQQAALAQRIDELITQMTLEEKVGPDALYRAGD